MPYIDVHWLLKYHTFCKDNQNLLCKFVSFSSSLKFDLRRLPASTSAITELTIYTVSHRLLRGADWPWLKSALTHLLIVHSFHFTTAPEMYLRLSSPFYQKAQPQLCVRPPPRTHLSWGGVQARTNREKIFYVQTHYCMWCDEVNCLSFPKDRRPEPSGKRYILYLYTRLSAHPTRLYHDSLSGWHCVSMATVNSFDVGLLVVVQPFSTLNVCVCVFLA